MLRPLALAAGLLLMATAPAPAAEDHWIFGSWEAQDPGGTVRFEFRRDETFEMTMTQGGQSRGREGGYSLEDDELELRPEGAAQGPRQTFRYDPGAGRLELTGGIFGKSTVALEKVAPAPEAEAEAEPEEAPELGPVPPELLGRWSWKSQGGSMLLVLEEGGSMHTEMSAGGMLMKQDKQVKHRPGALVLLPEYDFMDPQDAPYTLEGDTLKITLDYSDYTLTREP